jgi:glutathione S-transferase
MILLGASVSPFTRKVLVVAAEKGITFEHRPTNPRSSDDPDYLLASPFRKIPALKDGDYTLCDSTAIIAYLDAKHPNPAVIPQEARARGTAIWFEEMADTILAPVVSKVFLTGFLVGDGFTIADIAVTSPLINLSLSKAAVDPPTYPKLAAYYSRMTARPSFAKLIAGDRAMLGM